MNTARQTMSMPADRLFEMARTELSAGRRVEIAVKGDSMRPFLGNEDIVVLEPAGKYNVDDIVFARDMLSGKVVLHSVMAVDKWLYRLMGTGNLQQQEVCRKADIAGRVVAILHGDRYLATEDCIFRFRMMLWRRLLPARRYLLFLHRKLRKK